VLPVSRWFSSSSPLAQVKVFFSFFKRFVSRHFWPKLLFYPDLDAGTALTGHIAPLVPLHTVPASVALGTTKKHRLKRRAALKLVCVFDADM